MVSITAKELKQRISNNEDLCIIDVREQFEHEAYNIGGTLLPLSSLFENIAFISSDKPVIFYCQKGIRSQLAIQRLERKLNFTNLVNLSGGMDAWRMEEGLP